MADVFISYAHQDGRAVERLSALLEATGISCWWDKQLSAGARFPEKIEAELNSSRVVLVVWSKHSVASHWVADEAGVGRDTGRLIPVSLDGSVPPIGFRQFQTLNFSDWKGGSDERVADLIRTLSERTPENLASAATAGARKLPRYRSRRLLVAGCLVAVAAIAVWASWAQLRPATSRAADRLAVLRFGSLGETQPYFAEGVADELISEIMKIKGLEVTARASSFALTGDRATPANASRELGATLVLTGSVRNVDDTVRVQAQLVSAPAGTQIWSETFERPSNEIYSLQRDIAIRVARTASVQFLAPPARRVDPEAYQLYIEGRRGQFGRDNGDTYSDQRDLYRQAVDLDPGFAEAWSALGRNEVIRIAGNGTTKLPATDAELSAAEAASDRALEINPELAEAWVNKSDIAAMTLHWEDSVRFAAEALKYPGYHPFRAYSQTGRLRELLDTLKRVDRLDPFSERTISQLANVCAILNEVRCWLDASRRQLDIFSEDADVQMEHFDALVAAGDKAAARKLMDSNLKSWTGQYDRQGRYLEQHHRSLLGDAQAVSIERILQDLHKLKYDAEAVGVALESLGRAGRGIDQARILPMAPSVLNYNMEYIYYAGAPDLRKAPEFWAYAEKLGLLGYWRRSGNWPDFCTTERVCEAHVIK